MDSFGDMFLKLTGRATCILGTAWALLPSALELYKRLWIQGARSAREVKAAKEGKRDRFAKEAGVKED